MSDTDGKVENVIIIGSGPAGYTAALYTARADLEPLVFEGFAWGGLLQQTTEVENYPGYRDGVMGPEMMQDFRDQAERFGARLVTDDVTRVELSRDGGLHKVYIGDQEIQTKAVILAMGAEPKKLGVPGEEELAARGVSYCATCDAAFFKGAEVLVVGGGDAALDEGLFVTRYARKVHVVHRRDQLRASAVLQARAFANPTLDFTWDTVVTEILGDDEVEGVRLRDARTGAETTLAAGAVFPFIGHRPGSALFRGQLVLNEDGSVVTDGRTRTSVPGAFAAGDVADPLYRQAVTAAATGSMAAMEAARFLAEQARAGVASSDDSGATLDRSARAS